MKENEEGNLPSSNQIDVVELTRFALSRSLSKRLEYAKAREDRLESIQQYMKENKMSEKQKREIEEKFSRDFRKSLRLQRCTPSVDDYRTLGIIGRGSRGEIRLVRHKESNTVHAMKVFSKSDTISHGEINSVLREKDILRMINHPGVERLELAFQDVRNVYLILEFLVGGDLATILERRSRLNEEEARFLVAQIASTLNFLHTEHDIVYRDL